MTLYLDTSALVKLLVAETGSEETAAAVKRALWVFTSRIAYAEPAAALAQAARLGRLDTGAYQQAEQNLRSVWRDLLLVEVDQALVEMAGSLSRTYALRGFDAVHLASAVLLSRLEIGSVHFACWDQRLLPTARAVGFVTVPE